MLGNGVRLCKPFCTSSGIETLCGTHRGPKEVFRHVSQCRDPVQKTPFGLFLSGGPGRATQRPREADFGIVHIVGKKHRKDPTQDTISQVPGGCSRDLSQTV